jgi:prepilin-type N-terminal cleavage/methylation domain-containing protein
MTCRKTLNQTGFTLIEIIVTVVIVAILSAMILTFLSNSLVKSSEPVKWLKASLSLHKTMSNITADYNKYPKWRSGTTYTAGNFVVPTIRNGHLYMCTTPGVSSLTAEPLNWPTASATTVNDGGVIWTESGTLPSLTTLQGNIGPQNSHQNNTYGTYDIVYNNFVNFPVGFDSETTGGSNILKVTIKNDQGGTLTALFISN